MSKTKSTTKPKSTNSSQKKRRRTDTPKMSIVEKEFKKVQTQQAKIKSAEDVAWNKYFEIMDPLKERKNILFVKLQVLTNPKIREWARGILNNENAQRN